MGVLDSILKLKQIEQNEDILDQQTITSVLDTLMKSQQVSDELKQERQQMDVDLATEGLRFGETGEIEAAPDLLSSLEKDVFIAGEEGLTNIGSVPKSSRVFKRTGDKKKKEFDSVVTEEVLGNLLGSDVSDEDFELGLQELKDNRKSYEDEGVNVSSVVVRALNRVPSEKEPSAIVKWWRNQLSKR